MYTVIYEMHLQPGAKEEMLRHWKIVANYMTDQPSGALFSKIYFSKNGEKCIIHSRWPSKKIKEEYWPVPDDAPEKVKQAALKMESLYKQAPEVVSLPASSVPDFI